MRTLTVFLAALFLLAGIIPTLSAATPEPISIFDSCPPRDLPSSGFHDLPDNYVTIVAIDCLALSGITAGTSTTTYSPNRPVTRGQMALFLTRIFALFKYDVITGKIGIEGTPGPTGPTGPVGPVGPSGGATGPTGPQGIEGPQGVQGPQGSEGPQGIEGPSGGEKGEKGDKGDTGATGAAGTPGGPQGVQGPQGLRGPQGIAGARGMTGVGGRKGMPGQTGAAGVSGSTGHRGTAWVLLSTQPVDADAPGGSLVVGDLWVDTTTTNCGQVKSYDGSIWDVVSGFVITATCS